MAQEEERSGGTATTVQTQRPGRMAERTPQTNDADRRGHGSRGQMEVDGPPLQADPHEGSRHPGLNHRAATLDVVQFTPTEFELIGLKLGRTSYVLVWREPSDCGIWWKSRPDNMKTRMEYRKLQTKINEMFPNSMVQLIPLADKLIVRGQAGLLRKRRRFSVCLSERGGGRWQSTGAEAGEAGILPATAIWDWRPRSRSTGQRH